MQNDEFLLSINQLIENDPTWLDDYFRFLRFESVSSEPTYKPELLKCADWVVNFLKEINFEVEVWPTSGHPVIYASNLNAGKDQPTLLIYNHYDVQPVDPIDLWDSSPFEPTLKNGEVYARGAQDNKGQCFYVLQALKLYQKLKGNLPINIKLCIEGEEETGSHGLSEILANKTETLKADYLAIVDLGIKDAHTPTISLGTRGIVTMDVEVVSAKTDLHSGFHGGILQNPIHVLTHLLDSLRDQEGKITTPGFYDQVEELSEEDKKDLSLDFDEKDYFNITGAQVNGGEKKYHPLERSWTRPTLEVNGICGGYFGDGFKTVIPAKAIAKISCRLVPHQDPKVIGNLVAKFLMDNAPQGVHVKVTLHPGIGSAVRVSPQADIVKTFSKAYEAVFGKKCEYIYSGGSIPVVPELAKASGGETLLMGLGLASDQIHAPNEHFGVDRIKKGILIMAKAFQLLAKEDNKG